MASRQPNTSTEIITALSLEPGSSIIRTDTIAILQLFSICFLQRLFNLLAGVIQFNIGKISISRDQESVWKKKQFTAIWKNMQLFSCPRAV
jgi:hypothetical protein